MKNSTLILFLLALLCIVNANAQDTTISTEYFKLVRTYNTLDEVYLAHPELKPQPPKIVINDNEVLFYGDNREVVNRMLVVREEEIPVDDPNYGTYPNQIKIHRNYKVIDNELLGVWESYGYWDGVHLIPFNAIVFDKYGKQIANIKPNHDIKLAPNKEYFVSFVCDEIGMDTLFIYNIKGNIFPSVFLESYDSKIKFAPNSKFILIYDYSVKQTYVVNQSGKLEFSFTIDSGYLFDFFASPNCENILLSIFFPTKQSTSILMDKATNVIWDKALNRITNCVFFEKGTLLLSTLGEKGYNIIYMGSNGNQLKTLNCDDLIFFGDNMLLNTKGGKYYEYEINL